MLNAKYSRGCSHTWGGRGTAFLLRGRNGLVTIRKGFPGGSACPLRSLGSWVSHFPLICSGFVAEKWFKSQQVCVEALDNLTAAVISLRAASSTYQRFKSLSTFFGQFASVREAPAGCNRLPGIRAAMTERMGPEWSLHSSGSRLLMEEL